MDFLYDESNYRELIGDGEKIVVHGETRYLSAIPKPTHADTSGYSKPFAATLALIPRTEWDARIDEQERLFSSVSDFCDFPAYDQDGIPYCWINGPCQAFTTARRIQRLPLKIISSASCGGPITGYVSRGGWEGDGLEYLTKRGGATVEHWPNNAIKRSLNTPEVEAERQNYKILEALELRKNFDEWATACLLNLPGAFAYNWMSHVMMSARLNRIEKGSYGLEVRNSWSNAWGYKNSKGFGGFAVFREGRGTPDSGFVIRQVTASTPK